MLIQTNCKVITISLGNECQRDGQVRENRIQGSLHCSYYLYEEGDTHTYLLEMDSVSEDTWATVVRK